MKIIGNLVGTTLPKPNFKQTDPTKGDYIKNKPVLGALSEKDIADRDNLAQDIQEALVKADTAVLIVEQELSEEEKARVRTNVGSASQNDMDELSADMDELSVSVAYIDAEDNEDIENPDVAVVNIVVDDALSETSVNPVQNKVITNAINELISKGALPLVTTEHNGQFLQVVNGVWAAAVVPVAEEASF